MADRHRPAKRNGCNILSRAQSFDRDKEQPALLPVKRSQSFRHRDDSWDKKWEDQRQAEKCSQSRPWTRPGALDTSFWENREQAGNIPPHLTYHLRRKSGEIPAGQIMQASRKLSPGAVSQTCVENRITTIDNEIKVQSSDTSAHLSDDNTTTVTAEGKDNPAHCLETGEDICISSSLSQTNTMEDDIEFDSCQAGVEELEGGNTSHIKATKELIKTTPESTTIELVILDERSIDGSNEMFFDDPAQNECIENNDNQNNRNAIFEFDIARPASRCDTQGQESDVCASIKKCEEKTIESAAKKQGDKMSNNVTEPEYSNLCLLQSSPSSAVTTDTLILAAQDMTSTLSDALNTITSTPPPPPRRVTPSSRTPGPPTPPAPPTSYTLLDRDHRSLPTPPPAITPRPVSKTCSGERISAIDEPPPRPGPPLDIIGNLEKKIEIQYKKYPKLEETPGNDAQANLKSSIQSPETVIVQESNSCSSKKVNKRDTLIYRFDTKEEPRNTSARNKLVRY